jgi:hypothetical protein
MSRVQTQSALFTKLEAEISAALDPFAGNRTDPRGYKLLEVRRFLAALRQSNGPPCDLGSAVSEIRSVVAGVYFGGFDLPERDRCLIELSGEERERLQEHVESLMAKVKTEFPELVEEFPEQFSLMSRRG